MNGVVFLTQSLDTQATPIITLHLTALNATTGQTFWNNTIGHLWAGDSSACPMISEAHIFAFTYGGPYPALPALVALNLSDGREVWHHTFPCEKDQLDPTMCRSVLWNHQAVSDSMVFAAAGYLYGIDAASGNVAWPYGFTADNWNPLGYVNGVLYALNTPNGFSPFLSAFALTTTTVAVPEFPVSALALIAAIILATTISSPKVKKTADAEHSLTNRCVIGELFNGSMRIVTRCSASLPSSAQSPTRS
jgi:outer membrane protein assembly factor BamB